MTQIFKNFQSDALGNIPADMVLRRNAVNSDYQIAEDGSLKFLRYLSISASSAKGVSYTGAPSSGATEIYADIEDIDGSVPASARLVAYATDSPDNEYGAYNQAGSLTLYRRVGGSFTSIGTISTGFGQTVPQRLLLKVIPGTPNTIQARAWRAADPEPGTWSIETTDGSLTLTNGWSGHVGFAQSDEVRYKAIGIGTNNDPAPRAPISNESVISDIELIINIQQALTAELDINYDLRESLQSDLQSTWNMLHAINMDMGATWSIIQNLTADLETDWQIVQNVDQVVELPWTIESAIQMAIKDLNASWHIRHAVVASLNMQWQLLAALEIDLQSRWNIAESIITDMQLLFAQRQQVMQSATLSWHQISIAENSITFTWKLGDTVLPPISIIKIRPETRVFRAVIH